MLNIEEIKLLRAVGQKEHLSKIKLPNKYELYILNLLKRSRFLVGKELVTLLKSEFAVKDDYARKILQRAVAENFITSSSPVTFGYGQFAYLQPGTVLTYQMVKQICKENRPPLYRLMMAMDINNGIISYYEGLKVTSAPEEPTSSKVNTLNQLVDVLSKMEFVYEKNDENGVKYIIVKTSNVELGDIEEAALMAGHFNKMIIDCMFIPDILRWLRKSNLIDNIQFLYRNKKTPSIGAEQNSLVWDALAYTKTTGINPTLGAEATTIDKQTFVPLDIVIHRPYEQVDLDGFYNRVQIVINSVKTTVRKVLPIVIYRDASELIINSLSKLGFLAFNISSIFGTRIHEVITKFSEIQIGMDPDEDDIQKTVTSILSTLKSAGQDDNLKDLKGTLFEFLLYPVLKTFYPNAEIIHGKTLSEKRSGEEKEYYEYDYIIKSSNPKEIVIVELKGYSSHAHIALGDTNTKNTLRWFFRKTLPFAQKYFKKEIQEGAHFAASFITPAGYYDDGSEFLQKISNSALKPKKFEISYDGQRLLKMLEDNDFDKIKATVEKFYSKPE
ncbi:hypothetical protein [Daejeonella sp. JGW-45]|uniref:hypothetical protein n=1 Tax=Daejeonella sp. JGW-45 TaxID=3034148 RepID=UPI0023EC92BC|nr:hypothetical protein [Daejeonella sp. JGW-45]